MDDNYDPLSPIVIGEAIHVHKKLGPLFNFKAAVLEEGIGRITI